MVRVRRGADWRCWGKEEEDRLQKEMGREKCATNRSQHNDFNVKRGPFCTLSQSQYSLHFEYSIDDPSLPQKEFAERVIIRNI